MLIGAVTVWSGVTLKYGPGATKTPADGTKVIALVDEVAEGRVTELATMAATSALPSTAPAGTSTFAVSVIAPFEGIAPVSGTPSPFVSVTAEPFAYQRDVVQPNGAELQARLNVSCGSAMPRFTTLKSYETLVPGTVSDDCVFGDSRTPYNGGMIQLRSRSIMLCRSGPVLIASKLNARYAV